MSGHRLHFIDWLRVLAVLLLFPFHAGRVFNAGEPFYVKGSEVSAALADVLAFIGVWHMPILFVLAGASTYLALGRRPRRDQEQQGGEDIGEPPPLHERDVGPDQQLEHGIVLALRY